MKLICVVVLGLLGAAAIRPAKVPADMKLEATQDRPCDRMPEREPLSFFGPDGGLWMVDRLDGGVTP